MAVPKASTLIQSVEALKSYASYLQVVVLLHDDECLDL